MPPPRRVRTGRGPHVPIQSRAGIPGRPSEGSLGRGEPNRFGPGRAGRTSVQSADPVDRGESSDDGGARGGAILSARRADRSAAAPMNPSAPDAGHTRPASLLARAPWKAIAIIALAGVALRGILLWLVLPLDIQSDEANYLYLALVKERLGIYLDQHRYFWPPGYPWLLSKSIHAFGIDGLNVLRGLQVALSSVIGVTTMLFAWRLFSRRAAIAEKEGREYAPAPRPMDRPRGDRPDRGERRPFRERGGDSEGGQG